MSLRGGLSLLRFPLRAGRMPWERRSGLGGPRMAGEAENGEEESEEGSQEDPTGRSQGARARTRPRPHDDRVGERARTHHRVSKEEDGRGQDVQQVRRKRWPTWRTSWLRWACGGPPQPSFLL